MLGSRLRRAFLAASLAAVSPAILPAQSGGGEIRGVVTDADGQPVMGVDVIAQPDSYRAQTDSAGRFVLRDMKSGRYTVRARKLGYLTSEPWTLEVASTSRHEIELALGRRIAALDTMNIRADAACAARTIDGFTCRRQGARGVFLDYIDIDDTGARHSADIFRHVEGFRVELRPTNTGPEPVVIPTSGWRCLRRFVDGRPASPANRVPFYAWEVVALEVYRRPGDVPREYRRDAGNCSVAVYWTERGFR